MEKCRNRAFEVLYPESCLKRRLYMLCLNFTECMAENLSGESGRMVFHNRNNPSVPGSVDVEEITAKGIGLVDFTSSHEVTESGDDGAETTSFSKLRELSTSGGYGVIHTEDYETVVVGRVSGPSVMFIELGEGDDSKQFKAFQLSEYAEVDLDRFPDLHTALRNRATHPTLSTIGEGSPDKPGLEAVTDAFIELDLAGELEQA